MIPRVTIALSLAALCAALGAPSTPAQGRGSHASSATPRTTFSGGMRGRAGSAHRSRGRFFNDSGWLGSPYYYWDDESEYGADVPPAPAVVAQPAPAPGPAASPVEALVLEEQNGEWVRVPTGSEMAISAPVKPGAAPTSTSGSPTATPAPAAPVAAHLPPAVIVFRDGHMEELGKYMIQGDSLYTNSDYWKSGSWTRRIPLKQLDIPASLKLNQSLGTKFNLPSAPSEVMVRF